MEHETMEVYQVSVKNGFRPCPTCKNQGLYMTAIGVNPGENGNMRHIICPKCGRAWVVDSTLPDLIKAWNEGEGIQAREFPKRLIKLKLQDDGTIPKEMVVQLICQKPEGVETTVEEIYRQLNEMYGEEAVSRSREKLRRIFKWKDQPDQPAEKQKEMSTDQVKVDQPFQDNKTDLAGVAQGSESVECWSMPMSPTLERKLKGICYIIRFHEQKDPEDAIQVTEEYLRDIDFDLSPGNAAWYRRETLMPRIAELRRREDILSQELSEICTLREAMNYMLVLSGAANQHTPSGANGNNTAGAAKGGMPNKAARKKIRELMGVIRVIHQLLAMVVVMERCANRRRH